MESIVGPSAESRDPDVSGVPVSALDLGARATRCLVEAGIVTVDQLCVRTEEQLLDLPTFGQLGLHEVKAALARHGRALASTRITRPDDARMGQKRAEHLLDLFLDVVGEATVEGVGSVADLLELVTSGTTIDWVTADVIKELLAVQLVELGGDRATRFDWRHQLAAAYDRLDDRSRDLIDRRVPPPGVPIPTLEELAVPYGLTRERVRQLLGRDRGRLAAHPTVVREVRRVASLLSRACTEAALVAAGHDPHDLPTRLVVGLAREEGLLPASFPWRQAEFGGALWCVSSNDTDPSVVLLEVLNGLEYHHGILEEVAGAFAEAVNVATDQDVKTMVAAAAESSNDFTLLGGQISMWTGTHADLAVQALALHRSPMTTEELAVAAGRAPDDRGFANALSRERATGGRIIYTAEKTWALSGWDGVEEYQQLVDVMKERITAHGGSASVRSLQREIARSTGFSATSVQMAATMNPHFLHTDGVVSVRPADQPVDIGPPELCGRMFRHSGNTFRGQWWFDVTVDYNRMYYGSTAFPAQAAQLLGVTFGSEATLTCGTTTLPVSWKGNYALLFSRNGLKDLATTLGAETGDRVRFTITGHLEVSAERLPPAPTGGPIEVVEHFTGRGDAETVLDDVAYAIGLDGSLDDGFTVGDLLTRLTERGDADLIAVLSEVHPELAD